MNIEVFAVLKTYFDKKFQIEDEVTTICDLRRKLANINPAAISYLAICRFAVNEIFVEDDFEIRPGTMVFVLPPSSGG
jgi:sulfur-carrier protein